MPLMSRSERNMRTPPMEARTFVPENQKLNPEKQKGLRHGARLAALEGASAGSAGTTRYERPLPAVALGGLAFLAQVLDRDHALLVRRVEHDDALRRATRDADVVHVSADELAAIGDQHDLVVL
jgi:hypothetical protein